MQNECSCLFTDHCCRPVCWHYLVRSIHLALPKLMMLSVTKQTIIYWKFCFRVVPKLIGYVLLRKFKVHIQFGRIGIPFSLKDVKILKNGFSLVGTTLLILSHGLTMRGL